MRAMYRLLSVFALTVILLPVLSAQDSKNETPKSDPSATDEKKVEPKKKPIVRADENIVLSSPKLTAKVADVKAGEKEIVLTMSDPQKVFEFQQWNQKSMYDIRTAKGLQAQNSRLEKYKKDLPEKRNAVFAGDSKSIEVTELVRVRVQDPPPQYDAAGVLKKYTQSELTKLRGPTRLPGYTASFEAIKPGQIVEIYIPKTAPTPPQAKNAPQVPGKKLIGIDPNLSVAGPTGGKMKAYMIFILSE